MYIKYRTRDIHLGNSLCTSRRFQWLSCRESKKQDGKTHQNVPFVRQIQKHPYVKLKIAPSDGKC